MGKEKKDKKNENTPGVMVPEDKEKIKVELQAFEDAKPEVIEGKVPRNIEEEFYEQYKWGVAKWEKHNAKIADFLYEKYHPIRILDVGCGTGVLVSQLRDKGIDAWGFDISEYAISQVAERHKNYFFIADMRKYSFKSKDHWDIILMIEIVEHLSLEEAKDILKKACNHTNRIIFSSCPENTHKYLFHQFTLSLEEWDKIFEDNGFCRGKKIGFVSPWAYEYKREGK